MRHRTWRNTGRRVRLGPMDATIVFPLLFALVHPSWWKFWLLLVVALFMLVSEIKYGISPLVALRALRSFLAGRRSAAVAWWKVNRI